VLGSAARCCAGSCVGAGVTSPAEFFADENVKRIFAAAS